MTVDIMIPYYGDVQQMKDAVASALRQTSEDWRLVVIDDRYPDPAIGHWLTGLGDPRITYILNEHNVGLNENFRRCVELAENELTVIMGCDDVLLPNYVEWVERTAATQPEATIMQPGVVVIDENDALSNTLVEKTKAHYRPKSSTLISGEDFVMTVLRGNWLYFPSLAWRTDALKKHSFREGYDIVLDMGLLLDIAFDGGSLYYDQTLAFMYRRHSASFSSAGAVDGMRFEEERRFFKEMKERAETRGWSKAARTSALHLSSRLHAATLLPQAGLTKNWSAASKLLRHVVR
ncbi:MULTISPECIES: glycosyltransferase family 2 protein [Rothia]|uniref:Glycosyl transferase family 2 n=1 Tax=Rothia nasimurium TaxID=85336 RepID=A0A1Y1RP69_9MICC|nr:MULTISPECIES: glycosyltransferase [Rothia]ORC17365.1 glycosyl transferase family 2 [Rothia nasimurium]